MYLINGIFLDGPAGYLLFGAILLGLAGGEISLVANVFSYLSESVTGKNRNLRMSIANAIYVFTYAFGNLVSGPILDNSGYTCIFAICMSLYAVGAAYVSVWLKDLGAETPVPVVQVAANQAEMPSGIHANVGSGEITDRSEAIGFATPTAEATEPKSKTPMSKQLKRLTGFDHLKETVSIVIYKRPHHLQRHLNVLLFIVFYMFAISGE